MSDNPKAPTHRVYTLIPRGEDDKFWLNIGSVFPHTGGIEKGFTVILDALPLHDGAKLVCRAIAEPEPEPVKKSAKR